MSAGPFEYGWAVYRALFGMHNFRALLENIRSLLGIIGLFQVSFGIFLGLFGY